MIHRTHKGWFGRYGFNYHFEDGDLQMVLKIPLWFYFRKKYDDFETSNLFDLKRSAGFGGRVIMPPLGMLGIDIGWGFDNDPVPDWKSPEYHFIFGQQF